MAERPRLQKHHSSSSVAQTTQHSPVQRPAHAVGGQRARLGPRIPSYARNVNKLHHQRGVQLPRNTSKTQLRKNQSETALHRRNRSANFEVYNSGREAYEIPEETGAAGEEAKGRRLSEGSVPEKRGGGDRDDDGDGDSGKGPGPARGQAGEETAAPTTTNAPPPSQQPPIPPTFTLKPTANNTPATLTSRTTSTSSLPTTNPAPQSPTKDEEEMPVHFAPGTKPGVEPPPPAHRYPPAMWKDSTLYKVIPHLDAPPSQSAYSATFARRLDRNVDRRLANLPPGRDPILESMKRLGVDPTRGLREEQAAEEKEKEKERERDAAAAAAGAGGGSKKGRVANLKEQEGGKSFFSLARLFGGGGGGGGKKSGDGGKERKEGPSEADLYVECAMRGVQEVMRGDDELGAMVRAVVREKIGELREMRRERVEAKEALRAAEVEVEKKKKEKGKGKGTAQK